MVAVPLLHDFLIDSARARPTRSRWSCGQQRVTYGELDARSNALAHTLVARGVARGDRVVIFADNTVETVIAFWAVLKANAVVSHRQPADQGATSSPTCSTTAGRGADHRRAPRAVFADAAEACRISRR